MKAMVLREISNFKDGQSLGLTGFGPSGHQILKMAKTKLPNTKIYVFARSIRERDFARELGALWAGDTADRPPQALQAVFDTTPAWKPVEEAVKCLKPGGRLVINGICKEVGDREYLQNLNYHQDLWMEREIKSVASLTRRDVEEFLELAAQIPLEPEYQEYPLQEANQTLRELKQGKI